MDIDKPQGPSPPPQVLKTQWRDVLRVAVVMLFSVMQTTFTVYALAYATGPAVGTGPDPDAHRQRRHHRPVHVDHPARRHHLRPDSAARRSSWWAPLGCAVTSFGYFWAISEHNVALIFVFGFLNMTVFYSCWNGVWTVFFPEMFPAAVRYSGMAIGSQVGLILTGFAPVIATLLAQPGPRRLDPRGELHRGLPGSLGDRHRDGPGNPQDPARGARPAPQAPHSA